MEIRNAFHLTTDVLAGGRIEIVSPEFPVGRTVEVTVTLQPLKREPGDSVLDVLARARGKLTFASADEVDEYVRRERESWGE